VTGDGRIDVTCGQETAAVDDRRACVL